MAEETTRCPICGSAMELRMARKGPNAGNEFWGCSRYPKCRGTKDASVKSAPTGAAPLSPGADRPRGIKEDVVSWQAPLLEDESRVYFLSGGGRLGLLDLSDVQLPRVVRENLSNWCLVDRTDYEAWGRRPAGVTQQAIAVVKKIITRGRSPVVSPTLEATILGKSGIPFPVTSVDGPEILLELSGKQNRRQLKEEVKRAIHVPGSAYPLRDWCLDSDDEERFYGTAFARYVNEEALSYLHPQVSFTNLLGLQDQEVTNARVDFVFAPPGVDPLVIEIDGSQHRSSAAADAERDRLLSRSGLDVVRLSIAESESGRGPGWDRLRSVWDQRVVPELAEPWSRNLVWAPVLATRIQLAVLHAIEHGILTPGARLWRIRVQERDVSVAQAAFEDLWQLLSAVKELYACDLPALSLHLTVVSPTGVEADCIIGEDAGDVPSQDVLDLDVSAFVSYVFEVGLCGSRLVGWGARALLEIRSANVPRLVMPPTCAAPPATVRLADTDLLTYFLQYIFRKRAFRDGQAVAVQRCLSNQDSVVLLPTGAGKSLIYQLVGLLLPGVTMVVDPIVSLIDDQLYNLRKYGIDRAMGISSQIENPEDREQALDAFGRGDFFFCLVAPERLQTPQFRERCRALTGFTAFNLWVVDEAHCVSEWGHDFRTAYLNLGRVARDLGRSGTYIPPLLALTGTASRAVLRDVQRELQITQPDAIITPKSFDRSELNFEIVATPSYQKGAALAGALQAIMAKFGLDSASFFQPAGRQTKGGLVFCPHINGEHGIVDVAQSLRSTFKTEVRVYGGSPPKGQDRRGWAREKTNNALRFKENEFSLLVCTKAFGMGIDKPNIRYTVHYGIPGSLESFYQEAGRAGRDRQAAYNLVLFSNDNPERANRLLDPDLSLDEVRSIGRPERGQDDDVGRMLFFHFNSFAGVNEELKSTLSVMEALGEVPERSVRRLSYENDEERARIDKAIHRLHLLGIVEDYTLDYSGRQFELRVMPPTRQRVAEALTRYVQGYSIQRTRWIEQELTKGPGNDVQFLRHAAKTLLTFIYDVIERARRRALREMWLVASECRSDEAIRSRLLAYLQESEFTRAVDELLQAGAVDKAALVGVLSRIAVPSDAHELRGSTIRLLESQPDHPGLLLLRGFLEILIRPEAVGEVHQLTVAGVRSLRERYAADEQEVADTKRWLIDVAEEMVPDALQTITVACVEDDVPLARALLREYADEAVLLPATETVVRHLASNLSALATSIL